MFESWRRFWTAATRRLISRRIDVNVVADPALVSSSAVALSTSAIVAALMLHLEAKGILSAKEQHEIYERAVELLNSDQEYDGTVKKVAREVIERRVRPN